MILGDTKNRGGLAGAGGAIAVLNSQLLGGPWIVEASATETDQNTGQTATGIADPVVVAMGIAWQTEGEGTVFGNHLKLTSDPGGGELITVSKSLTLNGDFNIAHISYIRTLSNAEIPGQIDKAVIVGTCIGACCATRTTPLC